MQKKIKLTQTAKQREASYLDPRRGHSGMPAIDHAIQRLHWKTGYFPSVGEIVEDLRLGVLDDRDSVELCENGDLDDDAVEASSENFNFDRRGVPEKSVSAEPLSGSPRELPSTCESTTQSDSQAAWILRAPKLETTVNKLFIKLCRMPSDTEVAAELHLSQASYQDMLGLLHCLRMASISGQDQAGTTEVQAMPWSRDGRDLANFQCIRRGLLDLVSGAIQDIPNLGCLTLSFDYSDDNICHRDIYVTLERWDSRLQNVLATARLRLWVVLSNAQHNRDLGGPVTRQGAKGLDAKIEHVYLSASQEGWLSTRKVWERCGKQATWTREFKSSYSLEGTEMLAEFRRKEEYKLKLDS